MSILAFDTCLGAVSAAVNRNGRVTARFEACATGHAERLMPVIEATLVDTGIGFSDVTRLAVTLGPGGFTGLRVGISAARALALTLGVPVVGLTSLEVLAHGAAARLEAAGVRQERMVVAASAGRGGTYVQLFERQPCRALGQARLLAPDDVDPAFSAAVAIGPGAALLAGQVAHVMADSATWQPDAAVLAALAPDLAILANVRPIYLRAADAKPQLGKGLARAPDSRQT